MGCVPYSSNLRCSCLMSPILSVSLYSHKQNACDLTMITGRAALMVGTSVERFVLVTLMNHLQVQSTEASHFSQ